MTKFYGQWKVNNELFDVRRDALLHASKHGCPDIRWVWYNDIWEKFDISLLGTISLDELYKRRAQQLREKYDYLILSYSGGSDSHNVLMSFINNNIKLDQIFVHMPFSIINSSKHNPNTKDNTARNLMSEWNYVIEPTLKELARTHPEIKIELSDWTTQIKEDIFKKDISLNSTNVWGMGNLARSLDFSNIGQSQIDKGKTVATIYGADKPNVGKVGDKVYMYFVDRPMLLTVNNDYPTEMFYKTPDFPELAYEMAYQVYLYFKANIHLQKFIWHEGMATDFDSTLSINNAIAKTVCYAKTWDFKKFQAEKPMQLGIGKDRDWYVYELPEFQRKQQAWNYHYADFFHGIDKKYLGVDNQFMKLRSAGFFLGII